MQDAWVPTMVRELRSHTPLFVSKKIFLIKNKTQLSIIIANTYIGPTISQTLFRGKNIHLFT